MLSYAFAAVAKLNAGFFDPSISCSVDMLHDMLRPILSEEWFPLPAALEGAMPFAIAGVELAIPLMLIFRRTRRLAFGLIVGFHVLMPLMPSVPGGIFSCVAFALSFLFLPTQVMGHVKARMAPLRRLVGEGRRRAAILLVALMPYMLIRWGALGPADWVVEVSMLLILGALLADAAYHAADRPLRFRMGHWAYGLFLGFIALNALTPFMGGKTAPSFTMYSNIQTEGGQSNHFIFPRWPGETSQDRWVSIEATDDAVLQSVKEQGRLMSRHEMRRTLSQNPEAYVRFRDGDQVIELERAGDHPEWSTTHPVWHRLIYHRAIYPDEPKCGW